HIVNFIKGQINRKNNLKDKKILISASATREPIDRVRFITNYSTGKMGFALAETAVNYGADVTLITGPTCLQDPPGARTIHVITAEEMRKQVMNYFMDSDVFISAAAVADFKPVKQYSGKIKKEGQETFTVKLAKNIDILKEAGEKKTNQILVGFAAEAQDLLENALTKLKTKKLDYIIANDITRKDSGFGTNTNKVIIIDNEGEKKDLPLMSKHKLAEHILNIIEIKLSNRHNGMLL
ncbi:MAG: bifunctional phosphopantothenoylcysteine decarboxylase/phosphopantothenate--cysteine ligase CoaBC, partial [Arcobacteraceae bacterium]